MSKMILSTNHDDMKKQGMVRLYQHEALDMLESVIISLSMLGYDEESN